MTMLYFTPIKPFSSRHCNGPQLRPVPLQQSLVKNDSICTFPFVYFIIEVVNLQRFIYIYI